MSTADELRFSDGKAFSAIDPAASTLSVATPETIGFGGGRSARITVDRSEVVVARGSSLSLVGGDLKLEGANLRSEPGEIRLIAQGTQEGGRSLSGEPPAVARGNLVMDGSDVIVGDGGGTIRLEAGTATLSDTSIAVDNKGVKDAGVGIGIRVSRLSRADSEPDTDSKESGQGGDIRVEVEGELRLQNSSIDTDVLTDGKGGIDIHPGAEVDHGRRRQDQDDYLHGHYESRRRRLR